MHKRYAQVLAGVAVLGIVASACGSSGSKPASSSSAPSGSTTTVAVPAGGTLTIGAEQEPDCFDWVGSCGGSSWGYWMGQVSTVPSAIVPLKQPDGTYKNTPGAVLSSMPTVQSTPVETITYNINPKAVWSDGTAITCDDFKYTWDQIAHGKNIYDTTGYDKVDGVDTTNPKVAVVTFKEPFASWTALFSADYGVMPSHILEGKDRDALMKNGYSWSGGPWIMKWDKGVSVTLTPNPMWYGPKPTIKKVIFKILSNTAAEFQAFKSGEVSAIYPQPDPSSIASIKGGIAGTKSLYTADTGNVEALWMNNNKAPFNSVAVRQAVAYAIDRDAIVKRLFGDLGVTKAAQSLNPPILSKFSDPTAYSNYVLNLTKVNSLMQGDGWTKSGAYWTKGRKTAAFVIKSTAGNKRRELTEQILQEQLKTAGFKLTIQNPSSDDLFGKILPAGDYQLALYAQTNTSLNPSLCSIACSENIPSKKNQFGGENWQWINNPTLDGLLHTVDTSIVTSERISASKQGDQIMGQDQVSLPLDPLPNVVLWSDKISGPVGDNPILSMFWNMNEWTVSG
jgi:peptide/nickel transport system substrate-binding protein